MSPRSRFAPLAAASLLLPVAACGGSDEPVDLATEARPVIEQYAANARAGYAEVVTGAHGLDTAIAAFVATPSAETLAAARTAWVAARVPYRLTEAWRFYGGPIDDTADERETRINSWPLDEAYIDAVKDMPDTGIINHPTEFPTIDADTLMAANFTGGEDNVAVGYHAIEFLLWGQDFNDAGPGDRPFTDFVDEGTLANPDRRRAYLTVTSDLLVGDLEHVAGRWDGAGGDYTAVFTADPVASLTRILSGIGVLSASELSGERMLTAYTNKAQEDEHSCFSDTTKDDLLGNARGIENVYLGRWGANDGPGLDAIVAAHDPALDEDMKQALTDAIAAIEAIPAPFDQAILGTDEAAYASVLTAVRKVQAVGVQVMKIGVALDVPVQTELP